MAGRGSAPTLAAQPRERPSFRIQPKVYYRYDYYYTVTVAIYSIRVGRSLYCVTCTCALRLAPRGTSCLKQMAAVKA